MASTIAPDYKAENEKATWNHLDKDTLKDIGFSVSIWNMEKPVASSILYNKFDNLKYYKEIDISIPEFERQIDFMEFTLGEEHGEYCRSYFTSVDFATVMPDMLKQPYSQSGLISLSSSRTYDSIPQEQLPEKLLLKYSIVMADTAVTGTIPFVKIQREIEQVIRWH